MPKRGYTLHLPLGTVLVTDNCAVTRITNNAPATFPPGTNIVTWTATDASGNTATCQQPIVVQRAQFAYTPANGGIILTDYLDTNTVVTIPDTINGLPVTGIGEFAFELATGVTSVTLGANVTTIGFGAFDACTSLTNIFIPNSVTSIDDYAFLDCSSLASITIPASVTGIGEMRLRILHQPESSLFPGQRAGGGCHSVCG